jgi:hypothetical protein
MPGSQSLNQQRIPSLADYHSLLTEDRDTGNGYYCSARAYPSGDVEMTALRLNSDDSLRRGGGFSRKNSSKTEMTDVVLNKSLMRTRIAIRRRVLSMQADRMLTLTFRENVTDVNEAWGCLHYFVKLMRTTFDNFQYVAVPELQKRGAVHFHLAVRGFYPVKLLRKYWLRAVGKRLGNIDLTSPRTADKTSWNPKRVSNYISKYITKTDIVAFNKRRYSSGGKIEIPAPLCGWLALGVPVVMVLSQALHAMTKLPIADIWESESYFTIIKIQT